MIDVFVGRQPIYNRKLAVIGYELLFRSSEVNRAEFVDADQATAQLVLNALVEIGLDQIVYGRLAFLNLTGSFLRGQYHRSLPPQQVVLEIAHDAAIDPEVVDALRELSQDGYQLALDHFRYENDSHSLVEIAHIVKIDAGTRDSASLKREVAELRRYRVKLLADKVETHAIYELCGALGFDFFQGYFLWRPAVVRGRQIPTNRVATLRLLAELQKPDIKFHDLADVISQEVSLSYRLMRYLNSAYCSLTRRVNSIRQALVYLGLDRLRSLASVILLAGIPDKPHALMVSALVRAKMCELLGEALKQDDPGEFFTVGLFSVLDAMTDRPMQEVVAALPLSDAIGQALVAHEGIWGQALRCVVAYEQGRWEEVKCPGLSEGAIKIAYLQAIGWADSAAAGLGLSPRPKAAAAR